MNIVMIPSVGGGIGHIARTAILAQALRKLNPAVTVEYLLDTDRLRPFNIEAANRTGFRVNLLPSRSRESRDAMVKACLGQADLIVDDTSRYLIPLRQIVPQAAWVSIPLWPVGDELFMDWPFLKQTEAIIWAYPPAVGFPAELEIVGDKVLRTGPFLALADVPEQAEARRRLGFEADEELVVYAPRGMPFGFDFGQRVLSGLFGAIEALKAEHPRLKLVLLAVKDLSEIRGPGVPDPLPSWVKVEGVLSPAEALLYLRAADIAIGEGTSTVHEAAALNTGLVMIPGTIEETQRLGRTLKEQQAAPVIWNDQITTPLMAETFQLLLAKTAVAVEMKQRAQKLVTGGGGVEAAARLVLEVAETYAKTRRT